MSIARSASSIALWTGVSRVLGLVREIMFARYIGQNDVSDTFLVAFKIPNLFRRIFGEGALNSAFVPIFGKELEKDPAAAHRFAKRTFSLLTMIMLLITAALVLGAPGVVRLLAPGFYEAPIKDGADTLGGLLAQLQAQRSGAKFALTVQLTRICSAYAGFICLAALASGILNTLRSFAIPAFAPVLLNVILIAALISGAFFGVPVVVLSWAVFLAGITQLAVVWLACSRRDITLIPSIDPHQPWGGLFTPRIRYLFILMGPGVFAAAGQQIGQVATNAIASLQGSGITILNNGDRLQQLPLGMIGIAIGTVLLPELSRNLSAGQESGARYQFRQGVALANLLAIPSAVALAVLGPLIFLALYTGREFNPSDAQQAGLALRYYALGMPLWVLVKVLLPGYFARENTRTPLWFSMIAVGSNVLLALALFFGIRISLGGNEITLIPRMQIYGVALANSLAAVVNFGLLLWGLRHDQVMSLNRDTWKKVIGVVVASVGMGLGIGVAYWALGGFIDAGVWHARSALALLVGFGLSIYAVLVLKLGLFDLSELKSMLKRS